LALYPSRVRSNEVLDGIRDRTHAPRAAVSPATRIRPAKTPNGTFERPRSSAKHNPKLSANSAPRRPALRRRARGGDRSRTPTMNGKTTTAKTPRMVSRYGGPKQSCATKPYGFSPTTENAEGDAALCEGSVGFKCSIPQNRDDHAAANARMDPRKAAIVTGSRGITAGCRLTVELSGARAANCEWHFIPHASAPTNC
jgi:hypothetical protein